MQKLINAIKNNRLNPARHANDEPFKQYNRTLNIKPLFCSYNQIGYTIYDHKLKKNLQYDYELNKFVITD